MLADVASVAAVVLVVAVGAVFALFVASNARDERRKRTAPASGDGISPVGWHKDPRNPAIEWYWDGNAWTSSRPAVSVQE